MATLQWRQWLSSRTLGGFLVLRGFRAALIISLGGLTTWGNCVKGEKEEMQQDKALEGAPLAMLRAMRPRMLN